MTPQGLFENWANEIRIKRGPAAAQLMHTVTQVVQQMFGGQVHWAGSRHKATAIEGSDLDMWVDTRKPVTLKERRALAARLQEVTRRTTTVRSHVVRVGASGALPKVDIAFGRGAFGTRSAPDGSDFHAQPARQQAARALKFWARGRNFRWASGWALERMVVHLDPNQNQAGLDLFLRVIEWLAERANPGAVEAILIKYTETDLRRDQLGGRLEALKNDARRIRRTYAPQAWSTTADVGRWLR